MVSRWFVALLRPHRAFMLKCLWVTPQNVMHGSLRLSHSSHMQAYLTLGFGSQLPMVVRGSMYGPSISSASPYSHHRFRTQHACGVGRSLRSQLPDNFCVNNKPVAVG